MYRDYSNGKNVKNDQPKNGSNKNRVNHFAQNTSHRRNNLGRTDCLFKRGPNGYFYEVNNYIVAPYQKRAPKHVYNTQQKPKSNVFCAKSTQSIVNKKTYPNNLMNHFVKSSNNTNKPTLAFCNYCCKLGHISTSCNLNKPHSHSKYIWMRKDRHTMGPSSSHGVGPSMT